MSATARKHYAKKYTAEERAAYRQAQRDEAQQHLEAAVEDLQSSDGFAAWLRARAMFRHYSLHNTFMILSQCPDATHVAPIPIWNKLGRHVRKGEHAIRIWVRMDWHKAAEGQQPGEMNQWGQTAFYCDKHDRVCVRAHSYKLGPVFDASQTDGEDLPDAPAPVELDGDSHAHLEPALVTLAHDIGFTVSTEQLDGPGGYCDSRNKRIVVADGQSPNARIRVLVHEIAHSLGIGYAEYGRSIAETIVESATYIVLAGQGFDIEASSVPYVAGWAGADGTAKLKDCAEKIDEIARRIEAAL